MSGQRYRDKLRKAVKSTQKCLRNAAWQSCKCLMWVCCSPCICCAIVVVGIGSRNKRRRRQSIRMPEVPFPRRRVLTISSADSDWQPDQKTFNQSRSAFVHRLPLEIRRMIYQMALGGQSVHLGHFSNGLVARCCPLVQCRCCQIYPDFDRKLNFALPLMRTCRQIYSESVEYLYSTNSFTLSTDMEELATIDRLSYFMLPQRITQIRDLYINWELDSWQYISLSYGADSDLTPWYTSWEALSKLTGLQRLHIFLAFRTGDWNNIYHELWKSKGAELLEPIRSITAPRDFVVTLPDRRWSTTFDVGNTNCVLKQPAMSEEDIAIDDDVP